MLDLSNTRHGPLDALVGLLRPSATVELSVVPPRAKFVLRCRPEAMAAAGEAFGVALPGACRGAISGNRAALWLGPDEWLLLAPPEEAPAISCQVSVAPRAPHSLVDVSHRSVAITVKGPQAAVLINHGCPLDLSSAAFPVGMCTRTLFEKAEIILWRTEQRTYQMEIERSFATYVWRMIADAREAFI